MKQKRESNNQNSFEVKDWIEHLMNKKFWPQERLRVTANGSKHTIAGWSRSRSESEVLFCILVALHQTQWCSQFWSQHFQCIILQACRTRKAVIHWPRKRATATQSPHLFSPLPFSLCRQVFTLLLELQKNCLSLLVSYKHFLQAYITFDFSFH